MRRFLVALSSCAVLILAGCADRSTTAPDTRMSPRFNLDPNAIACTSISFTEITGLIETVFGAGSPDANSALGKWNSIQQKKTAGDLASVVTKTWDLIDFIVTKQKQNKLPVNSASERLGRALFCFAGINATLPQTANAWVVFPGVARTLVTDDGHAGLQLTSTSVEAPSLISIVPSADSLNTNLDKYPVVYEFSKYPSNTFASEITAAVCGAIVLGTPDSVLDSLVLGHNKGGTGFELLNRVPIDFLSCGNLIAGGTPQSLGNRLLAMLLPKLLYAAGPGASGIGGTLLEFSRIGPVDPRIIVTPNAAGTSAPIGSLVLTPPAVTLSTPNLKKLSDITVGYAVTSGGGSMTPAATLTNALGVAASTEWRLGVAVGPNSATATPAIGGSVAVPGVIFSPAMVTFTAQATGATGIEIIGGPLATTTYTAGATLPSATIRVIGEGNRTVEGYSGAVTVTAAQGGPLFGAATPFPTLAGQGTITGLSIRQAGATQQLQFAAGSLTANTGVFSIGAAAAHTLVINAGDNQTAPAGTVLGVTTGTVMPSVRVTDMYGNLVNSAPVYFTATSLATVTQTTIASGIATNSWTLQAGPNELLASLNSDPTLNEDRFKILKAIGTTTSVGIVSCLPGNQKDPIGSYAVRVDGVNRRVTDAAFYLSITGSANALTPYDMVVTAKVFSSGVLTNTVSSNVSRVFLRGSASEQKEANFFFPGGFASGNNAKIVFTIAPSSTQSVSGTIAFNAGTCAPGNTRCVASNNPCRAVNEVLINTPLGTVFRQSPAVKLLGF